MQILPLQWERGTTNSIGDRKLTFSADKSIDLGDFNPFKIEQGTQFIVILLDANSEEINDFKTESSEETKERFRKRMNSLITQYSDLIKQDPKIWREKFKKDLIDKKIIQKSTTELTIGGYARVIIILNEKIHDERTKTTRS